MLGPIEGLAYHQIMGLNKLEISVKKKEYI